MLGDVSIMGDCEGIYIGGGCWKGITRSHIIHSDALEGILLNLKRINTF